MKQPRYVYIGRLPCNCCMGVTIDDLRDLWIVIMDNNLYYKFCNKMNKRQFNRIALNLELNWKRVQNKWTNGSLLSKSYLPSS